MRNITLYYRDGSSDKVYQASIDPKGDGFVVNFAYGRRGSTLQTGSKTSAPVSYEQAKALYDKLVREKTAKGYSPGESGAPYQHTDKQNQATGILPQLLNSIAISEAVTFISNPLWIMQEKFDGKRMLLRKREEGIDGINRTGLITALPQPVVEAAASLPGGFILDGECIGDQLIAFDLLEQNGSDFRNASYRERLTALVNLVPVGGPHLCTAETAFDTARKAYLFEQLKREHKEGVVIKDLLALHSVGRPASGGSALKCKFVETASFIVNKVNSKRSVSLMLMNGDQHKPAGNVTVPPNHDLPAPGDVVECRYLYAFKESGCIYQPVYLGVRDDIPFEECTVQQLKFKPTGLSEIQQQAA